MKKNTMRAALLVAFLTMTGYSVKAQNKELKIGTNPTIKEPSAVLEVESTNKGMLMPRVTLTSTTDATTIATPANALTVFNTATAGTAPNNVTPGYYYWSTTESKWIRLLNQNDVMEPWQVASTTDKATTNVQDIYQNGNVGIGNFTATNPITKLDVRGSVRGGTPHADELSGVSAIGSNSAAFGTNNRVSGTNSMSFGRTNTVRMSYSNVNGGVLNTIEHPDPSGPPLQGTATIGGGSGNIINAFGFTTLAGGASNRIFGTSATISGGEYNIASTYGEWVGGMMNAIITPVGPSDDRFQGNDPIFQVGNGVVSTAPLTHRKNAITILKNGRTGIGIIGDAAGGNTHKPTELLDLGGTNTAGNGGLKIRNINSAAYTGNVATDKVVVADADGILKTVAVSSIAPAETNTTLSIAAGELVYTNEDANNANVNLISADADNTLVAGTDGRLLVPEPALENIYTTDGTLTSERTVTLDSKSLHFLGDYQKTTWSLYSGIIQEGLDSSPYNEASITLRAPDKDNDGFRGRLDLQSFAEGDTQIYAGSEATSLTIGTHATIDSAPLVFATSSGGGALATNKATITGTGEMGIATDDPTEKLDIGEGNLRVRDISANAGDATTDRVVVADADGVLKTVAVADIAVENIYNANGSLNSNREVNLNGNSLTFQGTDGYLDIESNGHHMTLGSSDTDRAHFRMTTDNDVDGDGETSNFDIDLFTDNYLQMHASGEMNGILFGTHVTQNPSPIQFVTSSGGNALGEVRMTIAGEGNIGIHEGSPTERLDVGTGNVRVRDIVANAGNNSTDRIVVADADGVLKTIDAFTMAAIRTETTNYAAVATDETILVNAAGGTVTVTLPATPTTGKKYNVKKIDSTANTVIVSGNGHNIDGNTTVSGTLPYQGWVMQFDGTNWFIISRI